MPYVPGFPVPRAKRHHSGQLVPSLEAMGVVFKAADVGGQEQRVPQSPLCVPVKEISAREQSHPSQRGFFAGLGLLRGLGEVLAKPEASVGGTRLSVMHPQSVRPPSVYGSCFLGVLGNSTVSDILLCR